MTSPAVPAPAPAIAGSARHLAWLYSPAAARDAVAALLALESAIDAGTRPGVDHAVAHARLAFWAEEVTALARGQPRHPLGAQLAAAFAAVALSPPDLRGLVEVARLDLACTAFESSPELAEYVSMWSNGLFRNLALLLCPDASARGDVERLSSAAGGAIRDIELVARLADDARRGRVHVALARHDAPPGHNAQAGHEPWQRQPWAAPHAEALRARLTARRSALASAAEALPASRRAPLRAALAWSAVAARLAEHCAAALPFQYDPARFDGLGSAWTAWRAALAATRGRVPRVLQEHR